MSARGKLKFGGRVVLLPIIALILGIGLVTFSLVHQTVPTPSITVANSPPTPPPLDQPIADPLTEAVERAMARETIPQPEPAEPQAPERPKQVAILPPPTKPGPPAWQRNAIKPLPGGQHALIAIVLDDMGVDRPRAAQAVALPAPLTMSYMAYAEDLAAQTAAARAHGHELMLHIPMEPLAASVDPGPEALRVSLSDDEIARRVNWDLARIDGIVGANNHMGSRFTQSSHQMAIVLQILHDHGLFFLDSRTTPATVAITVAGQIGMPHAKRDVFLDDDMSESAVRAQLARTEEVARRQGYAIAIGHPHDNTIKALRDWLPTVAEKGFQLVTVSAIVARNQEAAGGHVEKVTN
jgi:polysaccharide deacetylase 2 family uncharacterized protein YibQ